jgi:TM2 domain-containing membrane protein YozV
MLSNAALSAAPNPIAAAISAFIPGLGQVLQGRIRPGLLSFGLCLGLVALSVAIGRLLGA